jgi:hypothetical protein
MPPRVPHIFIDGVEHKKCSGCCYKPCDINRPDCAFGPGKGRWDNLAGLCKDCMKRTRAKSRDKKIHPENYIKPPKTHKKCNGPCGEEKELKDFYTERAVCKVCKLEAQKEYKKKTPAKAKRKEWRSNNRERINALSRKRRKKRRKEEPEWALRLDLGSRFCHILGGTWKCASTLELMGCTLEELRAHIETQFQTPMTWENRGPVWHVDHKVSFEAFKGELIGNEKNQRIVCWYKNLQPLWAAENLEKSGKWTQQEKDELICRYNEYHSSV